ncbi:Mediator of RNA polymerase II transcription subunit 4 [Pleurostoma richardsiae]|uniref:Mediator of RNA polymerase II transcription subunit 4 n=1 Tax=Pleurostoma richardsiae TaxID=41990 RepID=A0AA38R7A0_9PEZI|nr:Mediator of RNA polymerase II transcription subunit 4 [Pleurostoma richardsiae]
MDKYIDVRFERVEKALAALIDSISKYNPSTALATELAAADRELSQGLLELQTHQNNHLRIQDLRAATASLDTQIRDTLRTLASTRKDITSTVTTTFPDGPSYPIEYDELLSYARRISKTTLPPSAGSGGVNVAGGASTAGASPAVIEDGGTVPPTAAQTPVAAATPTAASGANGAPTPAGQADQQLQPASQTSASTPAAMPEHLAAYLNPLSGAVFVPWPAEDKIRAGSLAANQQLAEQGLDPRGYDPEEVARRQEQERREAEERERLEVEEQERRAREQRERIERERAAREQQLAQHQQQQAPQPGGGAGDERRPSGPAQLEKKQFQFMGDLDDDDE